MIVNTVINRGTVLDIMQAVFSLISSWVLIVLMKFSVLVVVSIVVVVVVVVGRWGVVEFRSVLKSQ